MVRRLTILCVAAALLTLLSACAVVRGENRYLSRVIGTALWPQSRAWRVVAAPVVAPLWTVGLVADALVVNPVLKLPGAVRTALVVNGLVPHVPFVEPLVFPVRVVVFPIVTIGADALSCMIPT